MAGQYLAKVRDTYIVLFLVVERLEFSLLVNFWEHPSVLEYFERPHSRIASVFQYQ